MTVNRLALTDFRNHRDLVLEAGPGFVLLSGPNGAGKTNILEAVSLLTPGRGLRRAPLSDMARRDGPGGFAVAARLADRTEIGTGTTSLAPERRQVRINGAASSANALAERLSVLWLTPAMDRLFADSAGGRRRFLDRLVLALEPTHAHHSARYEAAMRARNKLLAEEHWDESWIASLEAQMEEHGAAISEARSRAIGDVARHVDAGGDDFPLPHLQLKDSAPRGLAAMLAASRRTDAAARRATLGPNNEDLVVTFAGGTMPAALGSTGEQKALLIGIVLAHAALVAERRGAFPVLLLDEVAAHLDPARRAALYERLSGRGQVWMTGTEPALFDGIAHASHFDLDDVGLAAR